MVKVIAILGLGGLCAIPGGGYSTLRAILSPGLFDQQLLQDVALVLHVLGEEVLVQEISSSLSTLGPTAFLPLL